MHILKVCFLKHTISSKRGYGGIFPRGHKSVFIKKIEK